MRISSRGKVLLVGARAYWLAPQVGPSKARSRLRRRWFPPIWP